MKTNFPKVIGLTLSLLLAGSIWILCARAQQAGGKSSSTAVATNWVGYLVAGQTDTSDRITRNPSATVLREIEIGLRSDGVVVWREAPILKPQ
jgi:hypothetical protein